MPFVLDEQACRNLEVSARREWLLTNGIGGYAMGTPSGINTRRYHGNLIAATAPPGGRILLLANIDAHIQVGPHPVGISANQYPGAIYPDGYLHLKEFSVDDVAIWSYRVADYLIEKRLSMVTGANAVRAEYRNTGKSAFTLVLRPLVCHRDHHHEFHEDGAYPNTLSYPPDHTIVGQIGVSLDLYHPGAERTPTHGWYYRFEHVREAERGLPSRDDLYAPCELTYVLIPGQSVVVTATADPGPKELGPRAESDSTDDYRLSVALDKAARKFVVQGGGRTTILAGYPWFGDWGRDVMISLPGTCLVMGRTLEAREILLGYAAHIKDGLIPNRFTDTGSGADYNTVDGTLWFVNAVYKTLEKEWDQFFARAMFDVLTNIFQAHFVGTSFGIQMDSADGLLQQGGPGLQLTWMDAKIGDWVVTPRHGKPVEIEALWVNALTIFGWLAERLQETADNVARINEMAARAAKSFEEKFWHPNLGFYLDTVEPADASLRPNQVIALALPFSPVDPDHARSALEVVERELLTPAGLRTLGPQDPNYRGRFEGQLPDLDAAYHQGTVWPWLLGPYATALVKYRDDRAEARRVLRGAREMLSAQGLGGIAEVYDGDSPQRPNGCPWQAWSAAEILRAWVEDCDGD